LALECAIIFQKIINECSDHIDNGSEFMAEFDKLIKNKKIIHHFGRFHTLQGQRQIEKFNRTLKNYLVQYFQKYNTKVCRYFC
jgi:transposase InsO family protein